MIKLENVVLASPEQMSFIIEGMRNPMNSWEKSDSDRCSSIHACDIHFDHCDNCIHSNKRIGGDFAIGPNDHSLMQRLANAGTDHRKFMRMMPVYVRITAPLYWWKEFDTYKVGTVANSCSTMHKIQEKEFKWDDFSYEHLTHTDSFHMDANEDAMNALQVVINALNYNRDLYLKTKDKKYWWQMIQLLPSSYNQTRNVMMNYEVLCNIYKSRKSHHLDEWKEFCKWIEELPYSELICGPLVDVTGCKDCKYYISGEDMRNNEMYKDYNNVLGHDGLCMNTDKWTDEIDFCSDGKKKED